MAEFAKAVPVIIEQARNDSAADSGSVRQARRLTLILENYIDLLAQMKNAGLPTPGIDPVAESFRLADIARGSEVQRAMAASAGSASTPGQRRVPQSHQNRKVPRARASTTSATRPAT